MLIVSVIGDAHAHAVGWALEQNGLEVDMLAIDGFPADARVSQTISPDTWAIECGRQLTPSHRATWLRRTGHFAIPDHVSDHEAQFVRRESEHQIHAALLLLERQSRMTNRFSASRNCGHKPYQLGVARALGMPIPRTLVSNDPERIRAFYAAAGGRAIYKAMSLPFFTKGADPLIVPTQRLRLEHLEDDAVLSAAPGLFQQEIEKTGEVRVLILPNCTIALQFRAEDSDCVDWRGALHDSRCELIVLPDEIERACTDFLAAVGLDYGCFDFAIDRAGQFIFLEVNSEGQFLFMERRVPECRALEHFTTFLMQVEDPDRSRTSVPLRLAEVPQ